MIYDLKYASVNSNVFLAGHQLGEKLDPKRKPGLKLQRDSIEKLIIATFQNETAEISDFGCWWVPGEVHVEAVTTKMIKANQKEEIKKVEARGKIVAQVSTPHGHVHEGLGAGKNGQ